MLCDFVLTLSKLLVKTKKVVLEKICFQKGFEILKILKEKSGASKIESSTEFLTNMIHKSFILVLALHCYCGDENNIQISYKSLPSKIART